MFGWAEEFTCGMVEVAKEIETEEWPKSGCEHYINIDRHLMNARKLKVFSEILENPLCQVFKEVTKLKT